MEAPRSWPTADVIAQAVGVILAVLSYCSNSSADVLFDNGPTNFASGSSAGPWVSADDFTLDSPAVITRVSFVLGESGGDEWDGTIEWWIFENLFDPQQDLNSRNRPGEILFSGQGADANSTYLGSTPSGTFPDNWYRIDFALDSPALIESSDIHWIGFHLAGSFDDDEHAGVFVGSATDEVVPGNYASRNGTFDNWDKGTLDFSFALEGSHDPGSVQPLGDMDFDGDQDFDDIDDFVLGLTNESAYEDLYGVPPDVRGDINGDGNHDFDDIEGFVGILNSGSKTGRAFAVPEPPAGILAIFAIAAVCAFIQRQR